MSGKKECCREQDHAGSGSWCPDCLLLLSPARAQPWPGFGRGSISTALVVQRPRHRDAYRNLSFWFGTSLAANHPHRRYAPHTLDTPGESAAILVRLRALLCIRVQPAASVERLFLSFLCEATTKRTYLCIHNVSKHALATGCIAITLLLLFRVNPSCTSHTPRHP